jgi:putative oxidoreductase|tara:strand:- start:261 stop:644 length:384 start_codon:yes stop_codon:yes gene_type:complete
MYIVEFFGRVFLSALFLFEGIGKIPVQENVVMYMEDYGVPGILFLPATILEVLFPLFIIVGYKTKWAASIMALFTLAVAIIFHTDFSEGMQTMLFLKDLAIAGGFMIVVAYGPSKISLDHYFNSKKE